jgi:hypothetical protein
MKIATFIETFSATFVVTRLIYVNTEFQMDNQSTSWRRVLLVKLIVANPALNFFVFYGTQRQKFRV